jgi:hypothetical protein
MVLTEETRLYSMESRMSMKDIVEGLRAAALDPRVKGLLVNLPTMRSAAGVAQIQELRSVISEFGKTKETFAYAGVLHRIFPFFLFFSFSLTPSFSLQITLPRATIIWPLLSKTFTCNLLEL